MRGTGKGSAKNISRRTISSAGSKKNVAGRKPLCCHVNPVSCCMTERDDYDNIRPCSGRTDFCKEHLFKNMNASKAIDAYMNTMCDNCADDFVAFCEQVLKKHKDKGTSMGVSSD